MKDQVFRWIKIRKKEDLPEPYKPVLVVLTKDTPNTMGSVYGERIVTYGVYKDDDEIWDIGVNKYYKDKITHWAPFPKPPKIKVRQLLRPIP